jgi:hypothetical protein
MFPLPSKSQVGFLDPSIDGGSQSANDVNFTPPPEKLVMPDWSQIKKIRHYFGKKNSTEFFPAWIYHKDTAEKRIVNSAKEAEELGIGFRATTEDEKTKFGGDYVWDWEDDCMWRPKPGPQHNKFNPNKPETGKTVVWPDRHQSPSVEATVAAVMAALKTAAPSAPASVKSEDWEEFQKYLAFKKASDIMAPAEKASDGGELNANALSHNQDRDVWIETAEERGVKIDKRWSIEKIKAAIEKAA